MKIMFQVTQIVRFLLDKQSNLKLNVPGLRSSPHIMRTLSISPVRGPMAGKAIGPLDRPRSRLY